MPKKGQKQNREGKQVEPGVAAIASEVAAPKSLLWRGNRENYPSVKFGKRG
jgi:hypothetical protein